MFGSLGGTWTAVTERRRADNPFAQWRFVTALAIGLLLATSALVSFGWIATRGWVQSTTSVVEGRASEALALVGVALNRDMRGAWATVLVPTTLQTIQEDPPHTMMQAAARAFATFPYPESFIVWQARNGEGMTQAFNRTERWPAWDKSVPSDDPFPVSVVENPPALRPIIAALRERRGAPSGFVSIDVDFDGVPYQVVAHLLLDTSEPHALLGIAAFTVNLRWTEQEYFRPLLTQIGRIGSGDNGVWFSVSDEHGRIVASTSATPPNGREFERHFDMIFLDAALVSGTPWESVVRQWTVRARPLDGGRLIDGLQQARQTFAILAIAGVLTTAVLLVTVRAVRARAVATSMKSDFVSQATHELKTPLAFIRLVGDTLASGRYASQEELREYAGLLSQEAGRLGESINSLLTYARYGDPNSTSQITMASASLNDLVEAALERFRPTLAEREFNLVVEVSGDIRLNVDIRSMVHVFESIIDNAVKYSTDRASLRIAAHRDGRYVTVIVSDRGIGIPEGDLAHVFNRFYRARNASTVGSGLGLTIAQNIVHRHGGTVTIRSELGVGTDVVLKLKLAPQP